MNIIERFANQIQISKNGCWTWTSHLNNNGYGKLRIKGKRMYAHRFSYEYFIGRIPDGMQVDHLCRNRACVNPSHLEAVTPQENVNRGNAGLLNASKTHCKYGHEYSKQNTMISKSGNRHCRICDRKRKSTESYRAYQKDYLAKYRTMKAG